MRKLLDRYRSECAAWENESVDHIRGVTEAINEMCVAQIIVNDRANCQYLAYEPPIAATEQTIDFLVTLPTDRQVYFDVKSIQPSPTNSWERYERVRAGGLFTENTELILNENQLGGEIAHDYFATRQRFLEYTLEFEQKIENITNREALSFGLVFCGNGYNWHGDMLEDFADFYMSGKHRPDDLFGNMESYYIKENGITIAHSIDAFCYMERKTPATKPNVFRSGIRGPKLPF